jgi:mannosylglucosylglycerate synthase
VHHVVVSETRRSELSALMGIPTPSIRVVRNGIDVLGQIGLDPATEAIVARTGLLDADPLLLLPSRITPRKNIGLGLEVVAHLRRAGRPAALIVTGPVDPHDPGQEAHLARLLAQRRDLGLDGAAWFLSTEGGELLSDRVLTDLYRVADALFLPSREEGFGLPILEAALHRLPIICADLPVLREVAGDAATYLDLDADAGQAARAVLDRLAVDAADRLSHRVRRDYAWPVIYGRDIRPLLAWVARPAATDVSPR